MSHLKGRIKSMKALVRSRKTPKHLKPGLRKKIKEFQAIERREHE